MWRRLPSVFGFLASLIVVAASLALAWLAWNYYEYTPWTRDGRVRVYTVQVAPEVSGTVVALSLKDNQFVHKGDVLFRIDPRTYENAVKQTTGQFAQAEAQANYLARDASRYAALPDIAASEQQKEDSSGVARSANAAVVEGRGLLDQASVNLERTTVRSPVNGWITNLTLQTGGFANTGQSAMTLIDADSFWVDGYFEETQLAGIRVGNQALVTLMGYPADTMRGRVVSIGRGIDNPDVASGTQGLPSVNPVFTWVRLAQRIPVRIELDAVPCSIVLAAGMTATVYVRDQAAGDLPPAPSEPTYSRCDKGPSPRS